MFRVIGKLKERLGNRAKKKIIHDLPVHGDEGIQFRRNHTISFDFDSRRLMPTVWQRMLYGDSLWSTSAKNVSFGLTGTADFDSMNNRQRNGYREAV
jgi:hypothetical protein